MIDIEEIKPEEKEIKPDLGDLIAAFLGGGYAVLQVKPNTDPQLITEDEWGTI